MSALDQPLNKDSRGNLEVVKQDQFTNVIDLYLIKKLDDLTILNNLAIDGTVANVETTGHTPLIGEYVCFKEGSAFYQAKIINVAPISGNQYTITLNTPFDFAYTTVGGCSINTVNLAVDGSVTPQVFSLSPKGLGVGVKWDVVRVTLAFLGDAVTGPDSTPDNTSFGCQDAITKGIVLRHKNGVVKNVFSASTNQELKTRCAGDLSITPANKNGLFGVDARRTFNGDDKNGVVVRLESKETGSDEIQVIIQDNLTPHDTILVNVQGHVVED